MFQICYSVHIEITNMHCQVIACARLFDKVLTSAEGQNSVLNDEQKSFFLLWKCSKHKKNNYVQCGIITSK
jgi:hypothetical protein